MKKMIASIALGLFLLSCGQNKPTQYEGIGILHVNVLDIQQQPVAGVQVYCQSSYGFKTPVQLTDSTGATTFTELPSSEYIVMAQEINDSTIVRIGNKRIILVSGEEKLVKIPISYTSAGLKINEIYYTGISDASGPFWNDQFIELYNSSADTIYLDGMIIFYGAANELSGKDNDNDGDIDYWTLNPATNQKKLGIGNVLKLDGVPGKTHNYPILPGAYVVIAKSAFNHQIIHPKSIDLSHADFECYAPQDKRDRDNPDVPNFVSILSPEICGWSESDCNLNLKNDFVVITNGKDSVYCDGIDIDTIIDGVEYTQGTNVPQRLDDRIDAGAAGSWNGKIVEKYSGKSVQRILPGFDTNNSSSDFLILNHP